MSTVAEIAVEYAAKGSKAAVRADRTVRDSIQDTAKSAQSESSTINRWMERHKSAIQGIGAATAGVMGAIISASPTMRSEFAGTRMAFSLWSDTVVNDVLPSGSSLTDLAFELEQSYRDLPEPVREATSALILFAGVIGGIVLAGSVVAGLISGSLLVAVLALAGAVTIAYLAWDWFWGGLESMVNDPLGTVKGSITGFTGWFTGIWAETFEQARGDVAGWASWTDDKLGGLPSDALSWGKQLPSSLADGIRSTISDPRGAASSVRDAIQERIPEPLKDAYSWGADSATDLGAGIKDRATNPRDSAAAVRDAIQERIPQPLKDAYDWGRDAARDLGSALKTNAFRAGAGARAVGSRIDDALGGYPSTAYNWGRDTVSDFASGLKSRGSNLASAFRSVASDAASAFRNAFNNRIPSSLSISSRSISVPDVLGGGSVSTPSTSINIPQLDTGGYIQRGGLAELHAGEQVVPAAKVDRTPMQPPAPEPAPASGGGNTTVIIERGAIQVDDGGSPRRTAELTADEVSQTIQSETALRR